MSISTAVIVALGAYLMSWAVAMRLRRDWRADGTVQSISRAGVIGALELIRSVSGSAVVALLFVSLLLTLFTSVSGTAGLGGVELAQFLHGLATTAQSWMGRALLLAAMAALYFVWIRPTGRAIQDAYAAARQRELDRLKAAFDAGDWPEQPPTDEMAELQAVFARINEELSGLRTSPDAERERHLVALLEQCRSAWFSMDVQRRMNPDYALAASIFERSGTERLNSILALLVSRSLTGHIGKAQRFVARAASFLLVLSLVGWAGQVADANSAMLDLRSAQIVSSKSEAIESLKRAGTAAPPASEAEIDELAQQFDRAFVPVIARQLGVPLTAAGREADAVVTVNRLRARRQILDAATAADAKRNVRVADGIDLTPLESAALDRADDASVGRRFVDDLRRDGVLDSPEFWRRIRSDRFGPIGLRDASETVVSEVVGTILKGATPTAGTANEFQRLAQTIEHTAAKKAVMRAYNDAVGTFLTDVAEGTRPADALRNFSTAARTGTTEAERAAAGRLTTEIPDSTTIASKLAEREPALAHTEAMADDVLRDYAERVRAMPSAVRNEGAEAVRRIGSTYDDFFPRHAASSITSGSQVGEALAQALGDVRPPSVSVPRSTSTAARSARMVRGLRFVGGVVIGDEPSDAQTVDLTDLMWSRTGALLQLSVAQGGRTTWLGTFDPRIVRQALAYAADGRTVAVTMTSIGRTARGLKVLTHPALVDTPLGNDIIEVDRLVDTHGRRDGFEPTDEELLLELQLLTAHVLCRDPQSDAARDELRKLPSSRLTPLARHLGEPDWSLFAARPQFFHPEVREAVSRCAAQGPGACAAASISATTACAGRESWSGVREKAYTVTHVATPFEPVDADQRFQFLVQVVFVDPPLDGSRGASDEFIDPDPWEYPAAQSAISRRVVARMSAGQRAALRSAWQFTYLQRLFRNAIDGRLGRHVAGRLPALARDTARDLTVERTPRWSQEPVAAQARYRR